MGRASLLGLCPNSLHKVEVWACALGLRSKSVHILFSTSSLIIRLNTKNIKYKKIMKSIKYLTENIRKKNENHLRENIRRKKHENMKINI